LNLIDFDVLILVFLLVLELMAVLMMSLLDFSFSLQDNLCCDFFVGNQTYVVYIPIHVRIDNYNHQVPSLSLKLESVLFGHVFVIVELTLSKSFALYARVPDLEELKLFYQILKDKKKTH
jgi:hypothetical protein